MENNQDNNIGTHLPHIISTDSVDVISNIFKKFTEKYDSRYLIYLPSAPREKIEDLEKMLSGMDNVEFAKFTEGKEVDVIISEINSKDYINKFNVYGKSFTEKRDRVTNNVVYGENNLDICTANLNESNTSAENSELLMCKAFGLGEMINVPLWNSGFWIRLKPVTPTELITLELEIANNHISLGRDTLGMINSNENVIYADILTNFIKDHITNTNLVLPAGEDIRSYISIHDYYPILLALLTSMYPNGMQMDIECSNFTDKDIKCDYAANVKVDTKKLLWVDRSKITNEMFTIMCNKKKNSVTVDMAKEYQKMLHKQLGIPDEITIDINKDTKMIIGLTIPSIMDYVNKGSEWVNGIVSKYNDLVTESSTNDDKIAILNGLVLSQLMCVYSPYVSYVKSGSSDIEIKDYNTVVSFLKRMELENDVYKDFIEKVSDYIDSTSVSVVAIPDYTCPKCKEGHVDENAVNESMKHLIPLNMVHYFFVLRVLKIMKRVKSVD